MIEYVKGELTDVTPAYAVIECHGVGYGLNISLNTYTALQGKKEARLWVYEAIREDAYVLFGFATKAEREMFLQLITVKGVGAGTARMILSSLSVEELSSVIVSGNERVLKSVKGIGLRTAQLIIVELKDKIEVKAPLSPGGGSPLVSGGGMVNPVKDEAVGALTMLGFSPAPSHKVVVEILREQPDLPVEQVVKLALKRIK